MCGRGSSNCLRQLPCREDLKNLFRSYPEVLVHSQRTLTTAAPPQGHEKPLWELPQGSRVLPSERLGQLPRHKELNSIFGGYPKVLGSLPTTVLIDGIILDGGTRLDVVVVASLLLLLLEVVMAVAGSMVQRSISTWPVLQKVRS